MKRQTKAQRAKSSRRDLNFLRIWVVSGLVAIAFIFGSHYARAEDDYVIYETNPDPKVGEEVGDLYNHSTGERWIIYQGEGELNVYNRDTGEWSDIQLYKFDTDQD